MLIDVNVMKENFSKFLDSLINVTIGGPSKIAELKKLSGQVYVATIELPKQLPTIRELHTESQASGQGKVLIDVNVMKENFSKFLDSLIDVTTGGPSKIAELQKLSGQVYVATTELPK